MGDIRIVAGGEGGMQKLDGEFRATAIIQLYFFMLLVIGENFPIY